MKKEALRVSTTIPAAPTTLYLAWLNTEQHSAMTGAIAKIDSEVGGNFTALGGYISGKLVILDLGRRLVMSWRTTDFPREAPDSRVEIHLEAIGGSTRLTILHTEIPEGQGEKYRETWHAKYFTPMRTFFSKYLPDPRKPPPPRRPPPPEDDDSEETTTPPKKGKAVAPPTAPSQPAVKPAAPPAKSKPAPTKAAKAPPAKAPAKAPPAKAPAKAPPAKASTKTKVAAKPSAKAPAKAAPKKPAPKPAPKKAAKKPLKGKKK